jgi:predicted MFS family arabinose efflux permease
MDRDRLKDRLIIFTLWLIIFASSSQFLIIAPILPQLGDELNISDDQLGLLITSYALFLAFFAIVAGPISDRVGRRMVLLVGSGTMAVALLMHTLAFDFTSMLTVRALAGGSGGILTGACVAYIGDYFPSNKRGWANGWIATGSAAGQVLGIPLGSLMAGWFGFQSPFLFFSVFMMFAFLLILTQVPQPVVSRDLQRLTIRRSFDDYFSLLQNKNTLMIAVAYGLLFLSFSVFIFYLPSFLTTLCGFTGFELSLLFLIGGVASVIGGPWAGKISDKVGRKNIILISSIGLFVTMIITSIYVDNFYKAYSMFFVFMLLTSARLGPFRALVSEATTADKRGKLMSLSIAIGQLGMAFGGIIAGILYTEFGFWLNTIISGIAVLIFGILVWKYVDEPTIAGIAVEQVAK